MTQLPLSDLAYGFFDLGSGASLGKEHCQDYQSAQPFPHIVLDDLFNAEILDNCLANFPRAGQDAQFSRPQEMLKSAWNPDTLDPALRSFFYSFNSRPFLRFLENLTGVDGLISDPYFLGGGFHETTNGGKLDIHVDFNLHKKLNLERRLNVLVYLNKDWQEEFGGCLELWNSDMTRCERKIVPKFNRTVVFSTSGQSWHGHPEPVAHPRGVRRRSLALYYYTATWDENRQHAHSTQFRPRPNSADKPDYATLFDRALRDWVVPPGFLRLARGITGRKKS